MSAMPACMFINEFLDIILQLSIPAKEQGRFLMFRSCSQPKQQHKTQRIL